MVHKIATVTILALVLLTFITGCGDITTDQPATSDNSNTEYGESSDDSDLLPEPSAPPPLPED